MKIAMAQMSMSQSMEKNLQTSLDFFRAAEGNQLLFFPEIQLTPFFPQYQGRDAKPYLVRSAGSEIAALKYAARAHGLYASPNIYLERDGKGYDTSLLITPQGEVAGSAAMVHIAQAEHFYEQDYYTPSDSGFQVFETPFGKVGIVICFDRHLPESIRTCALKGAQIVIIPTANTSAEPSEQFAWEIRAQARQNGVFIAMCNRVGREDQMDFCGESMVAGPEGELIVKAGNSEGLVTADLDLTRVLPLEKRPYLALRRPEWYL
ncbi:MAG: carbon-nitrogen hydrolase family protein [Oscillibacter sp.]|jgi:N-carbamoylputrescine amidase|nr:carbon-nitrogen hydrolase family protein [Oscillibacter sp.]